MTNVRPKSASLGDKNKAPRSLAPDTRLTHCSHADSHHHAAIIFKRSTIFISSEMWHFNHASNHAARKNSSCC